jgi:hypothetical protein
VADTWFRFYNDAVNDPKVQKLPSDMFKAWVNLLCLASKNGGAVPKADVQFLLRVTEKCATGIVDYLVERNLLDDRGDVVAPHNWDGRQFRSDNDPTNADRQKRYRNGKRNAPSNVTRNAEVTPTEQNRPETEQKIDSAVDLGSLEREFRKIAKATSEDLYGLRHQLDALVYRGFPRETILAGAVNGMRGRDSPPPWNYFAKCIESENEQRSAPAKQEIARGASENLVQTAKRMSAEIVGFGPRPSLIGGGTDSPDVRLLPEGRGERS